ncbi:MAG: hypothetical protein CVU84_06270 [Firmicutes bacterium HGW-Firmicutes-1]|nr:MAG: hypothetical protein CVU84_06270 [Firmicutes bacterium HGW-Firmicutes-1]
MKWIIENKEWLFSGLLVAIPIAIIGWKKSTKSVSMKQKIGKNSKGYQSGNDMKISYSDGENDNNEIKPKG